MNRRRDLWAVVGVRVALATCILASTNCTPTSSPRQHLGGQGDGAGVRTISTLRFAHDTGHAPQSRRETLKLIRYRPIDLDSSVLTRVINALGSDNIFAGVTYEGLTA